MLRVRAPSNQPYCWVTDETSGCCNGVMFVSPVPMLFNTFRQDEHRNRNAFSLAYFVARRTWHVRLIEVQTELNFWENCNYLHRNVKRSRRPLKMLIRWCKIKLITMERHVVYTLCSYSTDAPFHLALLSIQKWWWHHPYCDLFIQLNYYIYVYAICATPNHHYIVRQADLRWLVD